MNFGKNQENSKSREPIRRYYCQTNVGDLQANRAGSFPRPKDWNLKDFFSGSLFDPHVRDCILKTLRNF
ncbi:MAG TPA: hypothetical protein DD473_05430 [Planctomycetaceae bacterium]|nr:hypothetical protein [Planctomycetaceae bacterium]